MISQTTEYALRAVVHLARVGGGPAVAQEIAEATQVPTRYLQKILRMLARAGIVDSQRGIGGGFTLAKVPSAISVLSVLRAVEDDGLSRIERCPLGIQGHTQLCALHRLLDEQLARIEQTFSATSIAQLITSPDGRPLCDNPRNVSIPVPLRPTTHPKNPKM